MSSQHEDRISSLPDDIICHILSFLPTEFAFNTSILSKRWNPLWRSVLTLYFDTETFNDFESFDNFVSFIFLSRDNTLPLHSFHLKWRSKTYDHNSHDIDELVNTAVQHRGIENLNLEGFGRLIDLKLKLPPTIFSCRTLVVLRLKWVQVTSLTQMVVDFPLLKTLHLSFVRFKRLKCLLKLLLGCPFLEELRAENLHSKNPNLAASTRKVLKEKRPRLPNLIRAYITNSSFYSRYIIISVCREEVQVLRVELETMYCTRYTFNNLAHMELILYYKHIEEWKPLLQVLKRCPKLQNLTINEDSWNGKKVVDNWKDPTITPKCLSTQLRTCLLKGYKCTDFEFQLVKYIMQNSKVLETMSIKTASSIDKDIKDEMLMKLSSLAATASISCKLLFD